MSDLPMPVCTFVVSDNMKGLALLSPLEQGKAKNLLLMSIKAIKPTAMIAYLPTLFLSAMEPILVSYACKYSLTW